MNHHQLISRIQPKFRRSRGFALVITLSLMVLLTLLAVGLLSLSSVTLRASSQGSAMALARSNARLALILALGELQKTTGSDRTITAPASILSERFPQGITGSWTAWEPTDTKREKAETEKKFVRWLASSPSEERLADPTQPPLASPDAQGAALMLGNGSLGTRKDILGDDQRIALESSLISTNNQKGSFAYLVTDEGSKARVDLYRDPKDKKPWANVARAGAPPTNAPSTLRGWKDFKLETNDENRLVTTGTIPLNGLVTPDNVDIYHPDVTVYSNSLMTNPVTGGLKEDLSMLATRPLSSTETNARLYRNSNAITDTQASDPYLSLLTNYHNLYKKLGAKVGNTRPTPWQASASLPTRHAPYSGGEPGNTAPLKVTRAPSQEPLLLPSVVRVDVIFSMITRRSHGGWTNYFGSSKPYLLHMQYLPVVTLHNPYSVPLVFEGMRVTFKNLPVGFNFIVDGQPLSTRLVALNQMYVSYAGSDTNSKDFGITLKPSIGGSASSQLTLEPGQTKLFGTPKVPPTWKWFDESPGAGSDGVNLFDWRSNFTTNFEMSPTMITPPQGGGAGFDIDWINPQVLQTAKGNQVSNSGSGMVGLVGTEALGVRFGPYAPPAGTGAFTVAIDLIRGGAPIKAGGIEVRYGDQARLTELLQKGTSVRFPTARTFPETYPKPGVDPSISAASIFEEGNTPIKDYIKSKQFMIFSLAAKTTLESFLPAKTLVAGNPSTNMAVIDLSKNRDPEGGVPLEMVLMPIRAGRAAIEENRASQEAFFFGGNGSLNGTPRATLYEFPVAPLQSLAQFRHANLASSGFMPFVTYTVGESTAIPHIGTEVTRNTWTDRSVMLDHPYLANEALWDRYFLSTIADEEGPLFGSTTRKHTKVLTDFFEAQGKLLNSRFTLYKRGATTTPESLKLTTSGNPAYKEIAAYLMLSGGFNINSTSIHAWKAVLSALDESEIETVLGIDPSATDRAPILRVRRPSDRGIDGAPLLTRQLRWQGYRRLTSSQIDELAKEIVNEVRTRGPFLSLSDFVNRDLGPESDLTIKGAIQAAIDRTSINKLMETEGKELVNADVSLNGYKSVRSGIGNTASMAPGMVTQGDVLSTIGSHISARSDTFRIRGYGEARDVSGRTVLANAWCEAIVQRVPEFVDPADQPSTAFDELRPVNRTFGRRYEIISFRWLNPNEV